MAFKHGKDSKVFINNSDFSTYFNSVDVARTADVAESTTFGNSSKTYITGNKDGTFTVTGFFDATADATIQPLLGGADMLIAMERMVPRIPLDAARWEGEMYEIANTFSNAGVTPKFHEGSADIMSLANKTPIANETRETVDTNRSLLQALDMYVAALKK